MAVESCVRPRGGCTCTETVITCTGDLRDPSFQRRFRSILKELRGIVCKGSDERLRVRKMEPWNSVRVTFSIGVEAAERLRALAEAGGEVLARLGILSVQLPNGQVISVRVNAPSTPPNVVAPAPSSIPPLVPSVSSGSQATRFPFNSMAQASAIVSREAKACATPSQSHYPPPPYPELRQDPPQASPLLVNLLQTDQAGVTSCPTGSVRPSLSRSVSYNTPTRLSAPPPPYTRPAQSPPTPRLPTPPQQPQQQPIPPHQQESSPTASSSDPTTTPVTPSGKPVQYLINPLTGVLEPMSSESESDAEGPSIDCSMPINNPRSPSPPLTVPPRHHQVPLVTPQLTPLPLQPVKEEEDKTIKVSEENTVVVAAQAPGPPALTLNQVPPVREDIESTEEERPKGEEKIKLRLKLEKTENYNLSYKAEGSEPRVPPLHISLRGRPAVVSRKEKRLRKDESRERERLERERERDRERNEREPLSTGTFEGTCQFPSEAEVASILRSMPQGGKLLNTNVTARRKRDKKKIYPRSVPRVEEKLKKGSGSLLKSVVKSAAKEVRIMTAQRSSKPAQHKKPVSPVLSNQSVAPVVTKPVPDLDFTKAEVKFKETNEAPRSGGSSASGSGGGDDSGIESMDALSEKSPNQSTSPLRKEELPKKEKKEVEEVVPIRLTPALYTYSNPERQREETPSPDHTEEERYSGKSLLEQLLIDIPNGDATDRRATSHRSPEIVSPTIPLGKRGRRPSESSSSDPPTPRPNKRKCSENASELIKACMDEGKQESAPLPQVDNADSSDDEVKRKEEDERLRLPEEKSAIRNTFNSRRSVRQAEIRERPSRKGSIQQKKEEVSSGTPVANKQRRRNSKEK